VPPTAPFSLGSRVDLETFLQVASGLRKVSFGQAAARRVARARKRLLAAAARGPIYGVNTGFGDLASRRIPPKDLLRLQRNIVLSHACGVGEPLDEKEARGILFLRSNELARGYSGVRPELVERLCRLINAGAVPLIPSRGSVGASGDLAPMSHAALLVLGEGDAFYRGQRLPAASLLARLGLEPLELQAKEGLSLLNGTQAMQSLGALALHRASRIFDAATLAAAMTLEAWAGTPDPYDAGLQSLKPHPGQLAVAGRLRGLLDGSAIRRSHLKNDPRVQDPYSLRAVPQIHGPVLDALAAARRTVEIEMNSATDNPLIVGDRVISGGHFHGEALSVAYDSLAAAFTILAGVSERRVYLLTTGKSPGLSPFLASRPGLESGWMIPQVAAAALASENKALAHPASVDSIPTSGGQEDFVSMGMGAVLKLQRVLWNAAQVVAIELLMAARGVESRAPLKPGRGVARGLARLRREIAPSLADEILSPKMERARDLVLDGYFS
jgi:histidine ammonia-lyase